jgi:hypothetical protein
VRKAPTLLAFVFILITLVRVAEFSSIRMKAGWLGWAFSIGLGVGVYLSSYFTREHVSARETERGEKQDKRSVTVQRWSLVALIIFALIDGLFNVAEVWSAVDPQDMLMQIATGAYGAFPTLAAALLGALQGHIDRLPKPPAQTSGNVALAVRKWIVGKLELATPKAQEPQPLAQPTEKPETPALPLPQIVAEVRTLPFPCPHCVKSYASQQALAAHLKSHKEKQNGKVHHATTIK